MQLVQAIVTPEAKEKKKRDGKASDAILKLQTQLTSPLQFKNYARSALIANLLSLGPTESALLCWIVYFSFKASAESVTFVTQNRLAQSVGVSTKTIQRFIVNMESRGVLTKLPQAIRERNGTLYFGPMQNRFSEQFRKLMTEESIKLNSRIETLLDTTIQSNQEEVEKNGLPKNLAELDWLYQLLNQNKSLLLKLVKLAGRHIQNSNYKTLNEMLYSYRFALETGEIKNPSAYLITRLMAARWTHYTPKVKSDQEHEHEKILKRRAEEAKQSRQQLLDAGKKKVERIFANQHNNRPIEMFDLTTNTQYRLLDKSTIQINNQAQGVWTTIDNAEDFYLKIELKHITQTKDSLLPARQNRAEKSDSLNKTKFLKQSQQKNGEMPTVVFFSKESECLFGEINITIKDKNQTASRSAIEIMRDLLKTRPTKISKQSRHTDVQSC